MDVFLHISVLIGLVCAVSSQSQKTRCLVANTDCTTAFYTDIQNAAKENPDGVKNDPNFGCKAADTYKDCLDDVTLGGCPEMDEGEYQDNVRAVRVNLKQCWKSAAPRTGISMTITSLLALLAICLIK